MKNITFYHLRAYIAIGLFFLYHFSFGQTSSVFNDDFSTPNATNYTIANGPVSSSTVWNMTRSGADFGSAIGNGLLYLTNDGSSGSNANGWVLASTSSANFTSPYATTLANNPGPVTWTFNMRQSRTNPGGFIASAFGTFAFGTAFILAGTNGTTNVTGTGYAIILGNSGSTDPIRLVRYNSGLRTHTVLLSSSTAGLTDFGTQYLSIRVVYTPSTNTWQLFVRNDGTTAFADPNTGTLTAQSSVVNNTYTTTSLPLLGGYFNGSTTAGQTSFFDNVRVTVGVPFITSIAPTSRIAGTGSFTLTVNGQNFSNSSIIRWNGNNRTTTYVSPTQLTTVIPASDVLTSGTASITVANGTTISNTQIFTIDPAGVPNLTTSTSVLSLANSVIGTASASSSYTINGASLTADPVITAPTNFEISLNNTNFFPSLTLPRTGNTITGQPLTIYVRTTSSAPVGIYNVVVNNTATGATTKTVNVTATVLNAQPTTLSSAISFSGITSTSFTANWTSGNGARRLLLVRQGSAVNAFPIDGQGYTASAQFGSGSEIGTGNFVVYSGTGNNATVTGLSPSTNYHVSVVEYNGSGGLENYTATGLSGNTTTLATPVGWQIYASNTVNTITFDATVDGVNNDVFQGDGVAPLAEVGQLSSRAWAFTGFSDGAVAFNGTSPEDSDYDQGTSTGGVTETGLYAFETSPNNFALGIQSGSGDFTPGTITLRLQNRTGTTMTSLNVGYKVYIYNDQASSTNFNLSYSANNSSYTAATTLNTTSPTTADDTPGWKAYYRVTTITGISIASGGDYYLRWESATASGSAEFDEFALDDISVVANPTSIFVPFSGTAESFVLSGNATQSSDLEVVGNITFNGGKLGIGSHTLTSTGTITNTIAGGIRGSASSNLVINGATNKTLSFDQTTVGTTNLLNNLTISTTANNTTTVGNAVAINGALNIATDQTMNMGTNALTGSLTIPTINGTLQTSNTSAVPLPTGKTWSGTGTVHYNAASSPQTVVAGTYNALTVSSTGGAVAGGTLTVNGTLNLPTANPSATLGSLSMGSFQLLMGGNATNTGIGDVTGDVIRNNIVSNVLYTFGHKDTSIIFPNIGTLPTSMGLRIQIGVAVSWRPTPILRKYDFIQSGGSGTKAIIKAHYLDSELNGNNENALVDWAYIVPTTTTLEQGRSNYNTTENWVELTNVNVGVFFQPTFGQVELTLDEYEAATLTWNGSVSDSWSTAGNWTPNAIPSNITTIYIPDASTTPNDPIINAITAIGKVNINQGGILYAPAGSELTVHGDGGAWINNGTFTPAANSTVVFINLDATIAGETTFNNLTINSGGGLRPLTGNIMHISGTFSRLGIFTPGAVENTVDFTGTGQTIPQLVTGLAAYNNLTITGSGAILPTPLGITGNLTLNNTVDFTGNTVVMKGLIPQSITGTSSPTFNNLTLENTSGDVTLNINSNINGTLTLNSGKLIVEDKILTLGVNPVAGSFDASKMIATGTTGEVRRPFTATGSYFFPIGENTSPAYSPIEVNVTSGSFSSAYVGVSVKDGIHPNNSSFQNNLSRYWNVNQSGITDAIVSINATYLPSDASADVSTIAAAQLSGVFNQDTNPWLKFGPLSGTTLAVAGAILQPGVTSAFTGIRAGDFTVLLSGYGDFCEDDDVTLSVAISGGDAPYTYEWSQGLGNMPTATPPTATVGTETYFVIVTDANGILAADQADVTVLTPSLGGNLSASQNVCLRTEPGEITLTGHTGNILYWQRSEDPNFITGVTNLSNFTDVLTSENAGIILGDTYFRAVISNGNCGEVFSGTTSALIQTTTWDGTWTNGVPDGTTNVIITGDFTPSADLIGCSIVVENGADVTIPSGINLTLNGAVIITDGTFTVEDDASLYQTDDSSENQGTNFTMKRWTEPMYRYDFTYWSSPVRGQTLNALSPMTLFDKYFGWNPNNQSWTTYPQGNHIMQEGMGYIVRAPQNYSTNPLVTIPFEGIFTGTPNNGIINVPVIGNGAYNLLGNPYPSALDADEFLQHPANSTLEGTIYLWTHNTPIVETGNQSFSYSTDDYAVYNLLGGVGTMAAPSETTPDASNIPNGFIAAGQGFFIEGITDGTATFNNDMRLGGNNNQFFRSAAQTEKHRLWLNISNTEGGFKQLLIGYATNATDGFDRGWDGTNMASSLLDFYSFVEDKKLSIQSFALPFDINDVVPVGYKTNVAGLHSINFNNDDGFFQDQNVYIHDKELEIYHDLKNSNYEFTTEAGTFDERFEIVYVNATLGNLDHQNEKRIIVYALEKIVLVKSPLEEIGTVKIIDMQGRVIHVLENVNSHEATLELDFPNQVLVVRVETTNGSVYNKKIIH
ncbi:hypothetical protein J2X31_001435 [Flavobacterium arsenatis]|uniref:Fibronectin type-III domain-containing protein n=1 Tax=Flavobacterium arsenatis TaxID=1484332 RepID=A0ABU1TN82_9FLAO|nr:hypothetical protein [Flavobacterium arsenatis]MDR6967424.1 hypothetical protein [Flavobacterium arsenatis]